MTSFMEFMIVAISLHFKLPSFKQFQERLYSTFQKWHFFHISLGFRFNISILLSCTLLHCLFLSLASYQIDIFCCKLVQEWSKHRIKEANLRCPKNMFEHLHYFLMNPAVSKSYDFECCFHKTHRTAVANMMSQYLQLKLSLLWRTSIASIILDVGHNFKNIFGHLLMLYFSGKVSEYFLF